MTRSAIVAMLCALSLSAHAIADNTVKRPINIPAQNLATALEQLSRQSGTDLVYRPEQVRGYQTRALVGTYSAEEAVKKLLAGTPLEVSTDSTGALLIAAPLSSTSSVPGNSGSGPQSPSSSPPSGDSLHLAQTSPGQTAGTVPIEKRPGPDAQQLGTQLEEVIVTAQKRSEDVQTIPVPVSVVTAADLQNRQVFEASQLQYIIPSLQVESVNNQVGATNFFIRGVGTAIYGPAVESSVSTVIDDVAMARPAMGVVQFFDLNRVEVLRGPQGTLFGKNASAGVVNIVTAMPLIGEFETIDHLSYGKTNDGSSGNEVIAQGAVNLPISADSAARISAFVTRQDGFATNVFRDEDLGQTEAGVRAKYLWEPSGSWQIYLAGDYARESGPGGSVLIRRFDAPGGFIAAQDAAAGIVASPTNVAVAGNADTSNWFELGGAQAKVVYSFADGYSLTNIAAYRAYHDASALDTDLLPISYFDTNNQGRDQKQLSDEFRFTSPAKGFFQYQLGLYYLYVNDYGFNTLGANLEPAFPPPPPGFIANAGSIGSSRIRNNNYAAFGQGTLALSHSLRLILGARETYDDFNAVGTSTGAGFVLPLAPTATTEGGFTQANFSYKVGAEADLASEVLGYATFARGYKSPTFGGPTGLTPIRPEIPLDTELGLKSTLFDRRLALNLALFHTRFEDFQAQAYDPTLLRFTTTNAGTLLAQGVELEMRALPAPGLSVSGGGTFNDAVYQSFTGDACYYGQPTGTSGRGVCLPSRTTDSTGNQLALAPRWVGSLLVDYQHSLTSGLDGVFSANYYYRSAVSYTSSHDPKTLFGGYGIFGGSMGVQTRDGHLRLTLFARNLFDKRVPTFIVADPVSPLDGDVAHGGDYLQQFDVSSFRTVGIALDVHF